MTKTVLIIAYLFPPAGGVGAIRPTKFARYLPDFGWNVVVLTVNKPAYAMYDETLAQQLPADLPIYRTRSIEPTSVYFALKRRQSAAAKSDAGGSNKSGGRGQIVRSLLKPIRIAGRTILQYTLFPDDKIGWIPFALRAGRDIIKQHQVDMIFTTTPPYSINTIGARLSRQTDVPWVVDFRDSLLDKTPVPTLSRIHAYLSRKIERDWFHTARRVITVTPPIIKLFSGRHPDLPPSHWVTLMNGYDEADFANISVQPEQPVFTLRYIGSLYSGIAPDLTPFLRAIRALLDRDARAVDDFKMSFTGNIDTYFQSHIMGGIQTHNLSNTVTIHPPVSHGQAIELICNASALFVTLADNEGARLAIHVKLFEYLRARRPILGLLPPSPAYDLLRKMDSAALLQPDDETGISQQLETWLNQWRAGTLPVPINPGHEQFERRALTGQLAQVFDDVLQEGT